MRYRDGGNLHKDFHLATQRTIEYVLANYGEPFLKELFVRTAQRVYREIHRSLTDGDFEPLVEHWTYYHDREGSDYEVHRSGDRLEFVVNRCAAVEHLREHGIEPDDRYFLHIRYLNDGFSEGTPFLITTAVRANGSYTQTVCRRESAAPETDSATNTDSAPEAADASQ